MLEKLNLYGTGVTSSGVLSALDSLPHLKLLGYAGLIAILAARARQLETESHQDRSATTYRLAELNFFDDDDLNYVRGDLAAAVSLCPDLSQVTVTNMKNTIAEQDLSVLTRRKTLTGLTIINCVEISFDRSILPILQSNSLESLKIFSSNVDIGAIVRFCPRLRDLRLCGCNTTASAFSNNPDGPAGQASHLSHLEKMVLIYYNGSADDLVLLLATASLVDLTIVDCSSLSDELLERAFKIHRFPHLKHLRLSKCHDVTKTGIDLFMTDKTPLKSLGVCGNNQLTEEDIAEWRSRVDRCNWQLEIDMMS